MIQRMMQHHLTTFCLRIQALFVQEFVTYMMGIAGKFESLPYRPPARLNWRVTLRYEMEMHTTAVNQSTHHIKIAPDRIK